MTRMARIESVFIRVLSVLSVVQRFGPSWYQGGASEQRFISRRVRPECGYPMNPLSRRSFVQTLATSSALAVLPRLTAQPASVRPAASHTPKKGDGLDRQLLRFFSPLNPKNPEASAIELKDGSILLLWTEFLDVDAMPEKDRPPFSPLRHSLRTEPNNDDGYARISGISSKDGGRTWSEPRVYVDDRDARVNTMQPGLARLPDGRLLLAYSWRSGGNHADNYGPCARRVRFSSDEGVTWSEPMRLTPDDGNYHTGCHDRTWVRPSGRILVQCHTNTPVTGGKFIDHKEVYFAYSDDAGKTWKHSNRVTENASRGLNEACIAPRTDGSLLMVARSSRGNSYLSESTDDGATWSAARPSGIVAPDSPTYLTGIPGTNDLLIIWNPNVNLGPQPNVLRLPAADGQAARTLAIASHAISRCPLVCALSRDGGRTWGLPKVLESDINYEWAYPSVLFYRDTALVHYYRSPMIERCRELMLTRVPIKWFYEESA